MRDGRADDYGEGVYGPPENGRAHRQPRDRAVVKTFDIDESTDTH